MRQSVVLLNSTQGEINVTGPTVKAAGYYTSGLMQYTCALYMNNFSGNIYIQASLAINPQEDDWFYLQLTPDTEYLEYLPHTPDGYGNTGTTGTFPVNFSGNYVFVRAIVDRTTLPDYTTTNYGILQQILLNY